ncbi:hypothetical protein KR032_008913, partial [Drosophila birchii]
MQFNDYTKYLDKACGMAFTPRFQWTGRPTSKSSHKLYKKVIFLLGTFLLGYQNFGQLIYWYLHGRTLKDTKLFVAELAEMCGYLMLCVCGFVNILTLTQNRPQIEALCKKLQDLYPRPGQRHYRCQHYFELPLFLMKLQYLFYVIFLVYYNGFPILQLLWEYLREAQNLSFRAQTKSWYPWKAHGSAVGFSAAFCSEALGSFIGVGMSLASVNFVTIFTFQLKLHYDALASQLLSLDSRHPKAHKKLKYLVVYHRQILELGEQFNHIFNIIFVISLVGSAIAICMTSIAVLLLDLASAVKAIIGVVAFVLYHFVLSYMGTEVNFAVTSKDPIRYVAELATVGSMLGFTIVGTLNLWKLLYFKPQIEEMLGDFEELFKHAKVNSHRTGMYYK